jgi:glyoxylase-like metal-dependent hydrolase (beta-lactamase superfamily II)
MPGHISLFLPSQRIVIAGDAMALEQRKPVLANPQFTLDVKAANASLEKLLQLDANVFICYHGGVYHVPQP